jgi:hypothetical protein
MQASHASVPAASNRFVPAPPIDGAVAHSHGAHCVWTEETVIVCLPGMPWANYGTKFRVPSSMREGLIPCMPVVVNVKIRVVHVPGFPPALGSGMLQVQCVLLLRSMSVMEARYPWLSA